MGSSPVVPTNHSLAVFSLWSALFPPFGTSFYGVRRLCERPGCSAPAEVSYGIDNNALLVWIDNRPLPERELAGRLCRRHADAISVPRGWSVDDRRQAIPQLFRPSDHPAAEPVKKEKKPAKPAKSAEPNDKKLSLFETIAEELAEIEKVQEAPVPAADPDETRAIPWSPRLSGSYEEDEDQDAPVLGRLMGRAFGQRRDEEQ
jgi:hypothetical protein